MKRRRRSAKALLLAIVLLLAHALPARATSIYDDLLRSVDYLPLKTSASDLGVDISASWYQLIKGTNFSTCTSTVKSSLDSAMSTGNWGITLYTGDVGNVNGADAHTETYVLVYWTDGLDGYNQFAGTSPNDYVQNVPGATPHREALIYIRDDDTASTPIHVECGSNNFTVIGSRPLGTSGLTWFNYDAQVYYSTFDAVYPSGYAGKPIPGAPPQPKYVAMGDSFSSGEGNPRFEYGTDSDGQNQCHRSPKAYPRLLQSELALGAMAFVACSGATTNDVLGISESDNPAGIWDEPAQISALSGSTELVTLSIGGNDVGFADFVYDCLFPIGGVCDEFTDIYEETIWKINNVLPGRLAATYSTILAEAENATIYVLAYPRISPYKGINDPFDQDCGGLYDEFPNTWGDARAAYEVTNLLNQKIEEAVTAQNSSRLVFVPVASGAFAGHDACSSDSYFHGIVWPEVEYSVHPNADGHVAYKEDLIAAMN